jgi:stage III sporulation protein AF
VIEFLKNWIVNIVIVAILLILFEIIIPAGKIKKIINLVSGVILIIAVINPFITLKNKNFSLSDNVVSDSFYIDKKEMENSKKILEDTQMQQITSVYKNKLISKIQEELNKLEDVTVTKIDVAVNQDVKSDKFGEIKKVCIELKKGKKQSESVKIEPVAVVKKVDISAQDTKGVSEKTFKLKDGQSERITELVKQNLNKTLEVQKDNIVVTVLEG